MRVARVDKNQKSIVELLRSYGAVVIHCHTLKNAFDLLVLYKGKTFIVEVKDGNKPLTDGEKRCKELVESAGVTYFVVKNCDDALALLEK